MRSSSSSRATGRERISRSERLSKLRIPYCDTECALRTRRNSSPRQGTLLWGSLASCGRLSIGPALRVPRAFARDSGGCQPPRRLPACPLHQVRSAPVLASQQMAFVDLTKQLAKEAFLSATKDPPAPAAAPADNVGAIVFGQIHGLQKALKDDEELVVWFANAGEKLRVMEIYLPSPKLAVLSGHDAQHNLTRVISPVDALQLVAKVMKVPPGAKASRVGLVMPKAKDSNG